MQQPVVEALAGKRTGRVRVHPGRLGHHQQVVVFEEDAGRLPPIRRRGGYQKLQAPLQTIYIPSRPLVIPCAVMASPSRPLRITSHW